MVTPPMFPNWLLGWGGRWCVRCVCVWRGGGGGAKKLIKKKKKKLDTTQNTNNSRKAILRSDMNYLNYKTMNIVIYRFFEELVS